ncbi:signal transduction histidine kinase [Scopulibacillus daqui]|uniref:histidine kinase n=1 Tax=Scopulibacillus daqui TaxID=1469162 RepID=A0ABS2Q1X6_9BACL|nr:sensor histidine kinase [Scopulibacillus daqui]MBM7645955.1 signal transduction histidine kinase [Scopulibacillus daqui]
MRFIDYVKDKRFLILFYMILMAFISAFVSISNTQRMSLENILYINGVAFIFFIIYIAGDFFVHKKYDAELKEAIERSGQDALDIVLPEPMTHEQKIYYRMIDHIKKMHSEQIEKLYNEKRENQDFIMSWVHEIKTPIAASKLTINNSGHKPKEDILDKLEDELARIDNFVEQALYYSRIDTFNQDYFIQDVKLESVVVESIKKHSKWFINKKISVEMDSLAKYVLSDRKWLIFIIDQILSNAIKYTERNGRIRFAAEDNDIETTLLIEDNGIGISPEDIGRVFEKGFTGTIGRQTANATGMGLYLSKKLAEKLGHKISIDSKEGTGTTVILHFPKVLDFYQVAKSNPR